MLEKEFVPYEEALALKELGFNEPCFGFWNYNDSKMYYWNDEEIQNERTNKWFLDTEKKFPKISKNGCTAPTFSQAFRWFRENYKLSGLIEIGTQEYSFIIFDEAKDSRKISSSMNGTPEEAELACLRNLIEIGAQEWFNRQLDKDKK